MTLNVCQIGHDSHESRLVDTHYGSWWIWAWDQYQNLGDYCTGCDEVSKSIDINRYWEKADTDRMLSVLTQEPGLVLDFGSHIGWFTVQALEKGCGVLAIDADPENVRLMQANIDNRGPFRTSHGALRYAVVTSWTVDVPVNLFPLKPVRFLKCDIEGHEWEMVNLTRHLWEARLIDYALLEISPIFENRANIMAPSYAELVDELIGYGYSATIHKTEGPWQITGKDCTFDQENVLFSKL